MQLVVNLGDARRANHPSIFVSLYTFSFDVCVSMKFLNSWKVSEIWKGDFQVIDTNFFHEMSNSYLASLQYF